MSNVKIKVEVDGKEVPLDTISTKTFERIKAEQVKKKTLAEKKEIPVARLATHNIGGLSHSFYDRLILKVGNNLAEYLNKHPETEVIVIELYGGYVTGGWSANIDKERMASGLYTHIYNQLTNTMMNAE